MEGGLQDTDDRGAKPKSLRKGCCIPCTGTPLPRRLPGFSKLSTSPLEKKRLTYLPLHEEGICKVVRQNGWGSPQSADGGPVGVLSSYHGSSPPALWKSPRSRFMCKEHGVSSILLSSASQGPVAHSEGPTILGILSAQATSSEDLQIPGVEPKGTHARHQAWAPSLPLRASSAGALIQASNPLALFIPWIATGSQLRLTSKSQV